MNLTLSLSSQFLAKKKNEKSNQIQSVCVVISLTEKKKQLDTRDTKHLHKPLTHLLQKAETSPLQTSCSALKHLLLKVSSRLILNSNSLFFNCIKTLHLKCLPISLFVGSYRSSYYSGCLFFVIGR